MDNPSVFKYLIKKYKEEHREIIDRYENKVYNHIKLLVENNPELKFYSGMGTFVFEYKGHDIHTTSKTNTPYYFDSNYEKFDPNIPELQDIIEILEDFQGLGVYFSKDINNG